MYLPKIELHEATSLPETTDLLARFGPQSRLLAGGTDLLVDLKTGRRRAGHLISLSRVPSLADVRVADGELRIGALTTIAALDRSPPVRERFCPLRDATTEMAVPQIRNLATVGGNIASAVPCADLPPILMAMRASVALQSDSGERLVPLEELFLGLRRTSVGETEILTEVRVPTPAPGFGAAYARFALRNGNAIAVASVAAGVTLNEDGVVVDARMVLGAVSPTPKLVLAATTALTGRSLDDEAMKEAAVQCVAAAEPISDVRGSAAFRRKLVGVLARRALVTARDRAVASL